MIRPPKAAVCFFIFAGAGGKEIFTRCVSGTILPCIWCDDPPKFLLTCEMSTMEHGIQHPTNNYKRYLSRIAT